MTLSGFLALALLTLTGCDKVMPSDDAAEEEEEEVVEEEPEAPPEQSHGAPDPLKGKSLEEICGMDGLALIKFRYDDLHDDFAGKCCGSKGLDEDNPRCEMDWPFNDVPSCDAYDDLRTDLMAHFGFPFKDDETQEKYAEKDWYTEREDYKPEWLPVTAKRNLKKLKELQKDKVGCE